LIQKYLSEGKQYTVRFFIPEGVTKFNDIIHGETIFNNSEIDDFVLLRSDGSPVYQIAVVVDDHDMGITHVIRGDDHLSNTPKQILLYQALNWELPTFAHLPMILDEEKKKLSKRRNTVAVEEYKDKGYLPEALFNFLTLLGYAPPDNAELISVEELVKVFSFERVNKKSAVFDIKKLNWINSEYIKKTDEHKLAEMIALKIKNDFTVNHDDLSNKKMDLTYISRVVHLMKERVSTLNDFWEFGKYFFSEPHSYDEKGLTKYWNEQTKNLLTNYLQYLKKNNKPFTALILENDLREFSAGKDIKAALIIHPLRLALTGITISPGIFEVMEVLGFDITINRIEKFINYK